MSVTFKTRHQSLASFLRYCLGDDAHLATRKGDDGRLIFEFSNPGQCVELCRHFFDAEEGVAVGDARALLACDREVRRTAALAMTHGEWRIEK